MADDIDIKQMKIPRLRVLLTSLTYNAQPSHQTTSQQPSAQTLG